ncbi:hypothetical protein INR49_013178, partial [Caranx melampygus]
MSNPTGDDSQSAKHEEEGEGEDLCFKIKAHLEDLFSDSHLAEDGFLLKHVQKNKQGYVSLKLLTCLKKIKALTTNWHVTLAAAERSDVLEVNDQRTKLGQHLCAVLKFDSLDAVRKTYSVLEEEEGNWKGICVVPLGFQSTHHISKDKSSEENTEDQPVDILFQKNPSEDPVQLEEQEASSPDKTTDTCQALNPLNASTPRSFEQISSSSSSGSSSSSRGQSFSGLSVRCSRKSWGSGDCDKESFQIPWVLRRKIAASVLNPKAPGLPSAPGLMHRVLRQPLGPDSTRGFQGR